jgi:hypothetical protein
MGLVESISPRRNVLDGELTEALGANLTEQVAKMVAGISTIGHARTVLERAGWTATITANRITVNQEIEAQFIAVNGKTWWQIYTADGTPPVWIVGAAAVDPANRVGAE